MYIWKCFSFTKICWRRINVLHKTTGRTCQRLFTACSRELENNLFGLLGSAFAQKPTKLQTLKFWNVRTLWLNVLISTICPGLSVKCVCICQMQSASVLWVFGIYSGFTVICQGRMPWNKRGPTRDRQRPLSCSSAPGASARYQRLCTRVWKKPLSTQDPHRAQQSVGSPEDLWKACMPI